MAGSATILIVDDEPNNVDLLEQELEGLGYSTTSASNGAEALAIVKTGHPDLILLDVMMPVYGRVRDVPNSQAPLSTKDSDIAGSESFFVRF
jgi:CheY-like chemotaxis protein